MHSDRSVGIEPTPLKQSLPRLAFRIVLVLAFTYAAFAGFEWLTTQVMKLDGALQSGAMVGILALVLIGYAVLIAIPFMPGIEVGIALLLMEGADVAPFVYFATLAGLFLAFAIGQFVPLNWLHGLFRDLRLIRICRWLDHIKSRPRHERLNDLTQRLPSWLAWIAVDYRYISLALLINLPGSVAIGGGGGIMLLAGISRLFHTGWVALTLTLAVLPVPLAIWIYGTDILK